MMIGIGTKVSFIPAYVPGTKLVEGYAPSEVVTGTVVDIHWEHKYFTVEYKCGDTMQRESFKFFQIGQAVKVRGK